MLILLLCKAAVYRGLLRIITKGIYKEAKPPIGNLYSDVGAIEYILALLCPIGDKIVPEDDA